MKEQGAGESITLEGGCHCGAVRFAVRTSKDITAQACNCSICQMTGYLHLIVPARDFTLLSGDLALSEYTFNTAQAKHRFCKICGIKSFYVPRSNPDGFSINVRCLKLSGIDRLTVEPFDGQNWEVNADRLEHLSQ